jgi:hypothetical protein
MWALLLIIMMVRLMAAFPTRPSSAGRGINSGGLLGLVLFVLMAWLLLGSISPVEVTRQATSGDGREAGPQARHARRAETL